jgi:hypothetical protein
MNKAISVLSIVVEQEQDGSRKLGLVPSAELQVVMDALNSPEAPSEDWVLPYKKVVDESLELLQYAKLETNQEVSDIENLCEQGEEDLAYSNPQSNAYAFVSAHEKANLDLQDATLNLMIPLVTHGLGETPLFEALEKLHSGTTKEWIEEVIKKFEESKQA